ncbi:hypothetical protein AM506_17035 [Rossellomorea vietnamensis]|uniref:Uncharacterized protein n=1 Tax=Rossellomorea vietnamensis TaxID=218284 RepID=A0A0P6VZD4_9BACI|nr:hypothetical protein AM506_17035 [Rossellomorea vietnamensis]
MGRGWDGVDGQNKKFIKGVLNKERSYINVPAPAESPKVKIKALDKYCKEQGVQPKDLTDEEMRQFLV